MRKISIAFVSVLLSSALLAMPGQAATQSKCPPGEPTQLVNGSFESPTISRATYKLIKDADVPGWSTTDSKGEIEIWSSGFQGVQAKEGDQFAEINANSNGRLYQDVATVPGQTLIWGLWHRARAAGAKGDRMAVKIGAPNGELTTNAEFTDALTEGWVFHSGTYVVPAGQTTTRFGFEAIWTAGGSPSIGNFLDGISFGTPACVELTKSVSPAGKVASNTELTYRLTFENKGGSSVTSLDLRDRLPANLTYVAESMTITIDGATESISDSSGGKGYFNPNTKTVIVDYERASDPLAAGEVVYVEYKAVPWSAVDTTIVNNASMNYSDVLGESHVAFSNDVITPLKAANAETGGKDDADINTIDPDPSNNDKNDEFIPPTPYEPIGLPDTIADEGTTLLVDHVIRLSSGESARVRVNCSVISSRARHFGDTKVKTCTAIRGAGGKVSVRLPGTSATRVVVKVSAPATKDYAAFTYRKVYRTAKVK